MIKPLVGPCLDGPNVMDVSSKKHRVVVAHRGDSGHYPENTAAACSAAVELGVECIELDVH